MGRAMITWKRERGDRTIGDEGRGGKGPPEAVLATWGLSGSCPSSVPGQEQGIAWVPFNQLAEPSERYRLGAVLGICGVCQPR